MTGPDNCVMAPHHHLMESCGSCDYEYTPPGDKPKWTDLFGAAPDMIAEQLGVEPGSSEDEVIPQAAIEAMCDLSYRGQQVSPPHAMLLLSAALPHLRAFQIETQVRVGYELGRREALEEAATMLDRAAEANLKRAADWKPTDSTNFKTQDGAIGLATGYQRAAERVREVTKGDPNG